MMLLIVALCGCASTPDFSKIAIGMDKNEVKAKLGKPDLVAAEGKVEFFQYGKWEDSPYDGRIGGGIYFVRFSDGKVDAFGKRGDFDTTVTPKQRIQIETINK